MVYCKYAKKTKKTRSYAKCGFSMIEVLLSSLIFSLGLVAVANLMITSLKSSVDTRNQIIAAQLAQEGVELVRNFRDNNIAFGVGAFNNIAINTNLCPQYAGKRADGAAWVTCPAAGSGGTALYLNSGRYKYGNAGGAATPFSRKVTVDAANPHNIVSMVVWGSTTFPAVANCNLANKCTYVNLSLNNNGWK